MTDEQIKAAIAQAIERVRHEHPLLESDRVHERSTAHRLAVHMEPEFGLEWNVDCEYDRDGQIKKAVDGVAECDDRRKTDDIFPDIIVHHRREHGRAHNLLVIEMK